MPKPPDTPRTQFVMIGGFLGAGKTTAALRLAEYHRAAGRTVALVSNDHGVGLADTALYKAHGFPVFEVAGGRLGCQFSRLADMLHSTARPDLFIAEPVGSGTDVAATVADPLRRLYGEAFHVSPFSVLVDPVRAERVLGLADGAGFSPKLVYVYLKQLEEAEIIVVNKVDTLDAGRRDRLVAALATNFPAATVVPLSARHGTHFDEWVAILEGGERARGDAMLVDYDVYAEGEALMGWVNLTATLSAAATFDGNAFAERLLARVRGDLQADGCEVAHLKLTVAPDTGRDLAAVNFAGAGVEPEFSRSLGSPLDVGELIVNLRAEADPTALNRVLSVALAAVADRMGVAAEVARGDAFRPRPPAPTHRATRH